MKLALNKKTLILKIFLSIILFLLISLFFSAQKIIIVLVLSSLFIFLKISYQKIIAINLIILVFFIKIVILPFQLKISEIDPTKTDIYEKHFLYGIRNIDFIKNYSNGDLSSLDKEFKEKYNNLNNKEIKIVTDNFGFRNEIKPDDADYILIGDSFLHQTNITQKNILNYILNKDNKIRTYNAGLSSTDISHYLETIKFFKEKMKLKNKKYIMLIFQGNDFLSYRSNDNNNYHKYINNYFLHSYFKFKTFFNFYNTFKYFSYSLKNNDKDFKKVYEHSINDQDVLFKFDYIYNENNKVASIDSVFKGYEKYLPDLIILIPTKYQVYCNFIKNASCNDTKHFSHLANSPMLTKINILDSTKFFKKKSEIFINLNNKLLYENDDTHLNELGIKVFSDFIYSNLIQ